MIIGYDILNQSTRKQKKAELANGFGGEKWLFIIQNELLPFLTSSPDQIRSAFRLF